MATFVLVHGAWHGSWCWKRVRKLLQNQGHEVFTPTLTGVADRSHLASPEVNLETHILDIMNLIQWEELSDIVLCGHSYGGSVIASVADRIPDRIRALVYLDAFLLENGENLSEYISKVEDGWKILPVLAEVFKVNNADREWVDKQCTIQPIGTWQQPINLTNGIDQIKNITYILAEGWGDGDSPFIPYYEQAQIKGWKTLKVTCGHDVMLDQPEELTSMLINTLEI
jgi:pimeloyl-ACP methyl ester carboxylesterase